MKAICVYCGSSDGRSPEYERAARALAKGLVERGLGLVYGGAQVGLMGVLADEVIRLGGRTVGVIPESLRARELAHLGLDELIVTHSMHERKTIMAERSDGFIALPGGVGTLEEIFEIWTWAQLGFHDHPCGFLNVDGYYDGLVRFIDHAVEEGFIRAAHRWMIAFESDSEALLDRFAAYGAPVVSKWVDAEDET